ncbi:MAG: cation-transporting P-type ATPase [Phytoplasma sp.]|uniref:cation-translocating P-type ATPase n=1 Tax=Phytoplasma sp. TaxID=2155 RepID=UPI002B413044|nr:cation-transporting P-type ATPase [Phytoplasma sp.]WRH06628.1 MAG: cation-transporting P-type ATPase [Phytoplasma sp.]
MKNKDLLKISSLTLEEVFQHFDTNPNGLSIKEVKKRNNLYGLNIIKTDKKISVFKRFIKQFISMFALLLILSSGLSFLIKEYAVGIAILTVVIVNGFFSFCQELKTDKILSSLGDMIPNKIKVYRNGKVEFIDAINLTIGDLIFLDIGVTIPADARLVETNNFYVDNSMLTGETVPLNKICGANKDNIETVSEIPNLVYAGTTVTQGSAKAIVYSIAKNTQIGEVSNLVQNIDKGISTLEKEIHKVIKVISIIASTLAVIVFCICLWRSQNPFTSDAFKVSITVALGMLVANIPEGLLPTINLSLAIGSQRMAKQKALIKQLFSVETLNSVSVICTDKTGTLTENKLTCHKILFPGGYVNITGNGLNKKGEFKDFDKKQNDKILQKLFISSVICSEANLIDDPLNKKDFQIVGSPTEGSFLIAANKYGLNVDQIRNNFEIEQTNPFSSETKKMSVLVKNLSQDNYDINERYLFIKGAPSVLLEECKFQYKNKKVMEFSQKDKDFFVKQNEELASQGYRLLAITYKKLESDQKQSEEKDMVFLGLLVNYDPPKIEVRDSIEQLYKAGLKVTVITGDYGKTAIAIGKQVGIIKDDQYLNIDGSQIDKMSQDDLQNNLKTSKPIIFSRTTPKHKLRIIEAYRSNEEIVGVIGDGVNDILAMKAAHISIAMGKSGKDIARNVADMILLDDNFSTIPKAVLEARGIYDNIKKFITYVFSSNIPQIFPVIFMALFNIPLYLTVMQILAIDLITDLIPAIALGAEEPKKELLDKKPISKDDRLLDKKLLKRSYFFLGIIEGTLALIFFVCCYGFDNLTQGLVSAKTSEFKTASTMAFGAVIFAQIGNVFACRSDKLYFWKTAKKKNVLLFLGVLCELILFILISQNFDTLNNFFGTTKISWMHYIYLISCIFTILFFDCIYKYFNNKTKIAKN